MTASNGVQALPRDTIFALASGSGRAGIAVVRVSGPLADEALSCLTTQPLPQERRAVLRSMFDLSTNDRIDDALVLRFVAPHSYTGENVVEFQTHGGRAVSSTLLAALSRLPGLRPAEPGEFTRRAVENGRLDLTQAEAVADLVNAETEAQRRTALRQLDGQLGTLYEDWRARLIRGAAWIEASIDFADEEIPEDAASQSRLSLAAVLGEIRAHLNDGRRGEILRDGFYVAVIGLPNAGKSSLVNALAKRDIAIVSDVAGTTRDVIEVRLDLKGYPVILADTAGLREPSDAVEREGVRRARDRARAAELRLLVRDGTTGATGEGIEAEIVVWNKADLVRQREHAGLWISAQTGEGLEDLIGRLAEYAGRGLEVGEAPVLTRLRHRIALEEAERSLSAALAAAEAELAAENVRLALRAIGRITGRVDLDELLDVVFRDFCIGK
jgi:tRNA modification GTPase